MDLQGIKMSNLTKFRKCFSLEEAVMKLPQFVRDFSPDNIFYESERDRELYSFINYCEKWRMTVGEEGDFFSLHTSGEVPVILWKEQKGEDHGSDRMPPDTIELHFQDVEVLNKMEKLKETDKKRVLPVEIAALCELAQCSCQSDELEEYLSSSNFVYSGRTEKPERKENPKPKENLGSKSNSEPNENPEPKAIPKEHHIMKDVFETEQGIIINLSVERFSLRQWKPSEDEKEMPIRTKRLIRESYSSYSGCTELNLADADGNIISGSSHSLEHELYANFIGDRLVEFLPVESRCGVYRIYKTWDKNGRVLLERDKNDSKQTTYQDTTGELGRMSSFAAEEDGGFVGISDGRLLSYTSMVNLPALTEETPVSICSKNGIFAVLTDQGNIVSNFAFTSHDICMICMDDFGYLYALRRDGKVITNHPKSASISSYGNILWIGYDSSDKSLVLKDEDNAVTKINVL